MKTLISILLILGCYTAKSQVIPVYFIGEKVTKDRKKATSYAVYGKLTNEELWVFKRYDLNNNLLQTGSYLDEGLSIPHGKFIFYQDIDLFNRLNQANFEIKGKTRFMSQLGTFQNGVEQGRWLLFFPDGNVMSSVDFVNGDMNGVYFLYDRKGKILISGSYLGGLKEGEWMLYKQGFIETYEKDQLKSRVRIPKEKKKNSAQ